MGRNVRFLSSSQSCLLFQVKNSHQFVTLTGQKRSFVLGIKRHSVIAIAFPDTVPPDYLIGLRIYHREDILILKIHLDFARNRVVLSHPGFTVEMQSLDDMSTAQTKSRQLLWLHPRGPRVTLLD